MNLSDVSSFIKLAESLSFTKAAQQVGCSRSAISKKIGRLEHALGVVLVNRSTRSVSLTEAGRTFYQHTSDIDSKLQRATDAVHRSDLQLTGTLAFTIASSLGEALMPALVSQFRSTWPDLKFNIHVEDRLVDLIAGGFDLAIRISQKLEDSNLVSQRLASTRKVLAASPDYLDKFGVPADISELKKHHRMGVAGASHTTASWRLWEHDSTVEVPCTHANSANNNLALVLAATLDNGIIYVPEICISNELRQQRLQVILPELSDPEPYGVFAIYPHRNAATKVKLFIEFIERELDALQIADECTGPSEGVPTTVSAR